MAHVTVASIKTYSETLHRSHVESEELSYIPCISWIFSLFAEHPRAFDVKSDPAAEPAGPGSTYVRSVCIAFRFRSSAIPNHPQRCENRLHVSSARPTEMA